MNLKGSALAYALKVRIHVHFEYNGFNPIHLKIARYIYGPDYDYLEK